MRNKKRAVLCGIAILLCALAVVVFMMIQNRSHKITYISCSWAYGYKDVEELATYSDVIAVMQVDKLAKTREGNSPASYYDVTVKEAIYGCEKGQTLQIYMTGGMDSEGDYIEIDVDPLMKKGQQFLIFAQKNDTGTYSILGGPQGRMEYKDKVFNSLNHTELLEPVKRYRARMTGEKNVEISMPGTVDVYNKKLDELMPEIERGLKKK